MFDKKEINQLWCQLLDSPFQLTWNKETREICAAEGAAFGFLLLIIYMSIQAVVGGSLQSSHNWVTDSTNSYNLGHDQLTNCIDQLKAWPFSTDETEREEQHRKNYPTLQMQGVPTYATQSEWFCISILFLLYSFCYL